MKSKPCLIPKRISSFVLIRQGRKLDLYIGHIDTLLLAQLSSVDDLRQTMSVSFTSRTCSSIRPSSIRIRLPRQHPHSVRCS